MWHVWGRRRIHTVFWYGKLEESENFEDIGTDRKIILNWILKK